MPFPCLRVVLLPANCRFSAIPFFAALDADHDAQLSPFEVLDHLLSSDGPADEPLITLKQMQELIRGSGNNDRSAIEEELSELDRDNDGRVSTEEFTAETGLAADQNGDGFVQVSEALQSLEGDMLLNEAQVDQKVDDRFADFDDNEDHQLTPAEVDDEDEWKRLLESDENHDEIVTREELKQFVTSDNTPPAFSIKGDTALMTGVITAGTPARLLELILEHPEVRTIILHQVPGSVDDGANLRASRYLRSS